MGVSFYIYVVDFFFFCFNIISACFFPVTSIRMVPFFKFFTVLGVIKAEILFSMIKGNVFVNGSFSFDSRMMKLGYGSSLSESHSIWGLFAWVFCFNRSHKSVG